MSKFNTYIRQINDIAAEAFDEYNAAKNAVDAAESKRNAYPRKNGMGYEYAAKSARFEAEYQEAKATLEAFKRNGFYNHRKRMDEVRNAFIAEIGNAFAADPAQLDMATIELMKSGILNASEYSRLMDKAINDGNHTMARMIAQHAKAAADSTDDREDAAAFRAVAYKGNGMNGNNYIEAFDFVTSLYDRCSRNPALYSKWDELAGEVIENF